MFWYITQRCCKNMPRVLCAFFMLMVDVYMIYIYIVSKIINYNIK